MNCRSKYSREAGRGTESMQKRIGILGGTFNPVHIGHLMLAEWAADFLALEQVWLMPAGMSWDKNGPDRLPGKERLRMTELAIRDNDRLRCSDLEIRRGGYTYTYETMEELNKLFPEVRFYFILGADCLFSLKSWKHPERLFGSCSLAAAVRDDISRRALEERKAELLAEFGGEICLLPFLRLPVSSSEIRARVRAGKSIRYLVPEAVRAYIMERGFYGESGEVSEKAAQEDGEGAGCQTI